MPWKLLETNFSSERGCDELPSRAVNLLSFPVFAGLTLAGFPAVTLWGGQDTWMAVRTSHSPWALQSDPEGLQEATGILLPALPSAGGP